VPQDLWHGLRFAKSAPADSGTQQPATSNQQQITLFICIFVLPVKNKLKPVDISNDQYYI
jgi:hypothetical protein